MLASETVGDTGRGDRQQIARPGRNGQCDRLVPKPVSQSDVSVRTYQQCDAIFDIVNHR